MDRENIKAHAQEISAKMMETFYSNVEKLSDIQGAEEQIYLSGCVSGTISATFILAMDGYAKIYDLGTFNGTMFKAWVREVEREIIKNNQDKVEDLFPH